MISKHSHTIPQENARKLCGVRGFLALWIVLGHMFFSSVYNLGFTHAEGLGVLAPLLIFHFLGVEFFFALSGMMLYLYYRDLFEHPTKSRQIDRFLAVRLLRLYPLFMLGCVVIGIMHLAGIPHPLSSGREVVNFQHWQLTLLLNAMLMNAWGIVAQASWNEPTWMTSIFLMLYMLFPNLVVMLKRTPTMPVRIALVCLGILILYYTLRIYVPLWMGTSIAHSDGVGAVMRGIAFFVIGCMIARLVLHHDVRHIPWAVVMPLLYAYLIIAMFLYYYVGHFDVFWFHLPIPLILLGLLTGRDRISQRLFGNRVLVRLGDMSYSINVLHYPLCLLFTHYLGAWFASMATGDALLDFWMNMIALTVILAVCWLSYRYVEDPWHRFIKRHMEL